MPTTRRHLLVGSLALAACRLHAHGDGPVVRQRAPGFALPDVDGRVFALDEMLARGPVVAVFYRGHW